jgi:hypothetical protein
VARIPGVDEPRVGAAVPAVWGVAPLLLAAGDALQSRFGALTVRGELSGFTRAASGHCYFSLKDADGAPALLRCAPAANRSSCADGWRSTSRAATCSSSPRRCSASATGRCTSNSCG